MKFLEKVEEGDSLTDLERKTQMSNVTIQEVVKELETSAVLSTRWRRTSRGRIKECTNISKSTKMLAVEIIRIIEGAEYFFEKILRKDAIDYPTPLIFQMILLHKTLESVSYSIDKEISKEVGSFFREWIHSIAGKTSEFGHFNHLVDGFLKDENHVVIKRGESVHFDPEIFTIFVDCSIRKSELKGSYDKAHFEEGVAVE